MSATLPQRQTIHSIHNKKFWTEFFCLYESQPALWDVNSPQYKNRQVKNSAYDIMVQKLREIAPHSDREAVLRKINIFRTNYRRECSRITTSLQEGRPYKSTLWYFDLLSFLQTQTAETRRERKRKLMDDDGEKTIMRKRRHNSTLLKPTDKFAINRKKEYLVEYQPQNDTDFDYDKYEEQDYDYVVEDLPNALVETKSENSDMHSALQTHKEEFNHDDDDDDPSQTEYEDTYRRYAIQKNITSSASSQNSKTELTTTTRHMGLPNTMTSDGDNGDGIILADGPLDVYEEYDSDTAAGAIVEGVGNLSSDSQWCLKTQMSQHLPQLSPTARNPLQICGDTDHTTNDPVVSTSSKYNENPLMTTKLVRDVKTMTSGRHNTCCRTIILSEPSEIMAKSWAIQYEELTLEQKVLARKAINDILFEGCLGHLAVGANGRVVTTSNSDQNKQYNKPAQNSMSEVESGEVYEQASRTSPTIALVSPDNTTNDQWLKL